MLPASGIVTLEIFYMMYTIGVETMELSMNGGVRGGSNTVALDMDGKLFIVTCILQMTINEPYLH
jgi:hypothetical protein